MSQILGQLVPGDAKEAQVRATYTEWMRHGLEVVQGLADRRANRPGWYSPSHPVERQPTRRTTWVLRPDHPSAASIEQALRAGWLVSAGTGTEQPAQTGALSGLTVAVKDIIDVAGLSVRNGTPRALWREPTESAIAWSRLAADGAQCIGKAATHEMAWGVTTPEIAHPGHPDHITGGSSGGSAACVAAHASQGALGTDTGGSVRIPAALCGVVGFRPTTGAVEMVGITPLAPQQDVVGPIAIDVRTCIAMLEVLLDCPLGPDTDVPRPVHGFRIGVLHRTGQLDPAVGEAYQRTVATLADAGADVIPCDTSLPRLAGNVSLLTMLLSSAALHAETVYADPTGFGGPARALLTIGDELTTHAQVIDRARGTLAAETARLFTNNRLDAFLTPTTPCTAPFRGAETVELAGRSEQVSAALTRFTAWASATAMPAVSVPVPASDMPVGVQIMAPPHREDTCAHLALAIEQLLGRASED